MQTLIAKCTDIFHGDDHMFAEDKDKLAEKCRRRRRRRIEWRRMTALLSPSGTSGLQSQGSCSATKGNSELCSPEMGEPSPKYKIPSSDSAGGSPTSAICLGNVTGTAPPYGAMSIAGKCREMEDAIDVRMNLCRPEIACRRPVHFFGLYDGHGGPHVASLCRDKMHVFLLEELMRVGVTAIDCGGTEPSTPPQRPRGPGLDEEYLEARWKAVMRRCFERMDAEATSGADVYANVGLSQRSDHAFDVALSGSTAVVAVATDDHIIVANCGDSRAVLRRAGRAVPLSFDHKPERRDELARIQACGGRVIYMDAARVEGVLAMSRAIGDKYLKPSVISEPEITFTHREPEDEFIIIASDGLWDVLSSDLACEVAHECLQEGHHSSATSGHLNTRLEVEAEKTPALYPSRSAFAAALLARLALARNSSDNISVIVIDLKRS